MINVNRMVIGLFQTNCWVIESPADNAAAIVDPGFGGHKIWDWIEPMRTEVKLILLTHGHFDHIMACHYIQKKTKAPCYLHRLDDKMRWRWGAFSRARFIQVEGGQTLNLGAIPIKVIHTPGHSPGSVSYLIEDHLFAGDLLFADGVGRWDIAGGDFAEIIQSLKQRIADLPDETRVMPGHGPSTMLGIERKRNPIFWKK